MAVSACVCMCVCGGGGGHAATPADAPFCGCLLHSATHRDGTLITLFQSVEADSIARRLLSKLEVQARPGLQSVG
jgi:hypothetical protein